ncbi:MAG: hypothetical protein ACOZBL_05795 [Patescibacteria group bacterium]
MSFNFKYHNNILSSDSFHLYCSNCGIISVNVCTELANSLSDLNNLVLFHLYSSHTSSLFSVVFLALIIRFDNLFINRLINSLLDDGVVDSNLLIVFSARCIQFV